MTNTTLSERVRKSARKVARMTSSRVIALAMVACFGLLAMQPAQAQTTSDTWKSIAIIGGSTAAGAYIGHKVGGTTGTYIGAGAGAAAGYAIDRHRRNNAYYNNQYAYDNSGYYGPSGPYDGNGAPYYGNGGNYGGSYSNGYPYPAGYRSTNYQNNSYVPSDTRSCRRR
jgi:hypothetical protein